MVTYQFGNLSLMRPGGRQFKLIHAAFIPFLAKPTSSPPYLCPQCGTRKPSLTHRFWLCPPISTFLDQLIALIHKITGIPLQKITVYSPIQYKPKGSPPDAPNCPADTTMGTHMTTGSKENHIEILDYLYATLDLYDAERPHIPFP